MKCAFLILSFIAAAGVFTAAARSGQPVSAGSGAELYSRNCATCHGRDGHSKTLKGKLKHARNLSDPEWQTRVSDERIFNSIMNGKGKMPPYGKKLSEQDVDALVTYVRGLKK
jgi:mono/diheme cytochrome c family protein